MIPGDQYTVPVTVANTTLATWTVADQVLSYKWALPDGTDATTSGNRLETALPQDVSPGETVTVNAAVKTPIQSDEGNKRQAYVLQWDLRNRTAGQWLSEVDTIPPLPQNVAVEDPTSDQLGLERFYAYTTMPTGAGSAVQVNQYAGNVVFGYNPVSNPSRGLATFVRLTSGGVTAGYNYDPFGRLDTVTSAGTVIEDYSYDGFDRVGEHRKLKAGVLAATRYGYDPLDRTASRSGNAGTPAAKTTDFAYLGLSDQVLDERVAGQLQRSYQYTPFGQRLSQVKFNPAGGTEDGYYGYNPKYAPATGQPAGPTGSDGRPTRVGRVQRVGAVSAKVTCTEVKPSAFSIRSRVMRVFFSARDGRSPCLAASAIFCSASTHNRWSCGLGSPANRLPSRSTRPRLRSSTRLWFGSREGLPSCPRGSVTVTDRRSAETSTALSPSLPKSTNASTEPIARKSVRRPLSTSGSRLASSFRSMTTW